MLPIDIGNNFSVFAGPKHQSTAIDSMVNGSSIDALEAGSLVTRKCLECHLKGGVIPRVYIWGRGCGAGKLLSQAPNYVHSPSGSDLIEDEHLIDIKPTC